MNRPELPDHLVSLVAALFPDSSFGVVITGPEKRITYINTTGCRLLETEPEQCLGKPFVELTAVRDVSKGEPRAGEALFADRILQADLPCVKKAAGGPTISFISLPLNTDTLPAHHLIFIQRSGISSEKESSTSTEKAFLDEVFHSIAIGVVLIDEATHEIIDINREAEKMIGLSKDRVIGHICHHYICPTEKGKCPITDLNQSIDHSEKLLITANQRRISVLKTVVHTTVRSRRCLLECFIDISHQKQAESLSRREKFFAEALIENAPMAVVVCDQAGVIGSVNPFLEKISGFSSKELLHTNICDTIMIGSKSCFSGAFPITSDHVRLLNPITSTLVTKQLAKREIVWYASELIDIENAVNGYLLIGNDITEQKQIEHQLHHSEKLKTLGRLTGGITHDFNNQLACIQGYAEMLRDQVGSNTLLSCFADNILIAVKHASDLTGKLLSFARKGKNITIPFDLHKCINEITSLLEFSIDRRIVITAELNAITSIVKGDPTQIQNVLLNLAINARDAMPHGGILTFRTDLVVLDEACCRSIQDGIKPGPYIHVRVTDTGIGMDGDVLSHVFEPFFTTKEEGKGVGMGLAAVVATIKNHKGAVLVQSEAGKGTSFSIYLPISRTFIETGTTATHTTVGDVCYRGSGHILVVDDEPLVRSLTREMLDSFGYTVHVTNNGREAVEYYRCNHAKVDGVLLDLIMPELNGYETALELKSIRGDVRILLSTGYALSDKAHRMITQYVTDTIHKPYNKVELFRKITRVTSIARGIVTAQ